jgi:hypothetical protein
VSTRKTPANNFSSMLRHLNFEIVDANHKTAGNGSFCNLYRLDQGFPRTRAIRRPALLHQNRCNYY